MLEVRGVSASYGKHRALESVNLNVAPGEIVVILGANGAGKSTLLKSICGICEGQVTGTVSIAGTELSGLKPHKIVEEGVALVPEGRGIFPDLSVQENLMLGSYSARARDEESATLERVLSLFPKLAERRKQVVRTMSGGEQQMVAIGRAMMSNPTILALDEPSLGLSPLLSKELFQNLKRVKAAGLGILMVEQNARQSLAIADRGYLLENGQIAHEDSASNLLNDPAVAAAYLGGKRRSGVASAPAASVNGSRVTQAARTQAAERTQPPSQPVADIAAQAMASFERSHAPRPKSPVTAIPPPASQVVEAPKPARLEAAVSQSPSSPKSAKVHQAFGIDLDSLVSQATEQSSTRGRCHEQSGRLPTPAALPASSASDQGTKIPMPSLDSSADRLQTILREIEDAARRAEHSRKF